mmetsp:Transcript_18107/g.43297  ORF Transcript_18107/g.43297 Transcript_18107/m.43297 type:complete len:305 (+) Transcript_18107:524-1438(+)
MMSSPPPSSPRLPAPPSPPSPVHAAPLPIPLRAAELSLPCARATQRAPLSACCLVPCVCSPSVRSSPDNPPPRQSTAASPVRMFPSPLSSPPRPTLLGRLSPSVQRPLAKACGVRFPALQRLCYNRPAVLRVAVLPPSPVPVVPKSETQSHENSQRGSQVPVLHLLQVAEGLSSSVWDTVVSLDRKHPTSGQNGRLCERSQPKCSRPADERQLPRLVRQRTAPWPPVPAQTIDCTPPVAPPPDVAFSLPSQPLSKSLPRHVPPHCQTPQHDQACQWQVDIASSPISVTLLHVAENELLDPLQWM